MLEIENTSESDPYSYEATTAVATQFVEHHTGIAKVMSSNPVEVEFFFWQLLELLQNCEDHFH